MAAKKTRHLKAIESQAEASNNAGSLPLGTEAPDPRERIAELAYFKAKQRGFEPGRELQDWIDAEAELGQ